MIGAPPLDERSFALTGCWKCDRVLVIPAKAGIQATPVQQPAGWSSNHFNRKQMLVKGARLAGEQPRQDLQDFLFLNPFYPVILNNDFYLL
jgi:hypothetical protein